MKLGEFIDKYCQDIVQNKQLNDTMFIGEDLPYDSIMTDLDGKSIRVIYVEGMDPIPIEDIILMDEPDFNARYPAPIQQDARKKYLEYVIILEGQEALRHYQNQLKKQYKEIEDYKNAQEDFDLW